MTSQADPQGYCRKLLSIWHMQVILDAVIAQLCFNTLGEGPISRLTARRQRTPFALFV